MPARVIWRRLAEEDLAAAYVYIGAESPAAAERLVDAVEDAVRFLTENPDTGRRQEFRSPSTVGMRSWIVRGFEAYLIFYRVTGDELELVRFLHGARDRPSLLESEP